MSELLDLAQRTVREATTLGAEEVVAVVSSGSQTTITRRGGRVEQATEAITRGLSVSLLVEGKWSTHGTSDLRPDALHAFLSQAVAATRYLEADPDRALPDAGLCGRGASEEALDQQDPAWAQRSAADRASDAKALEGAVAALSGPEVISAATWVADGASQGARVMSNGFADEHEGAWFSAGGEMTLLDDDGRRPEAYAAYGMRYLSDLPSFETIAQELVERARERLGSGPIASGSYPMILLNRAAGKILGVLGGPLAGSAIHHGRSCLADAIGTRVASEKLTIIDDPLVPRGLASRPWDGDALVARRRTIVEDGILREHYLDVYYARKLGREPTTGGRSNWVVPAGDRSWQEIARAFPKAILVNGFLGGNSNSVTGDFSFGVRGVLLEHGEPTRSLSEMNVAGNLLGVLERLVEIADDPYVYSSTISPTLVFDGVQFSGT